MTQLMSRNIRRDIRLTVPLFLSSRRSRSKSFLFRLSSMAILTCTSLVLIKSTTTPNRSRVPNTPAKKPCETFFRLELTLRTIMCSLMVTAVGMRSCLCSSATSDNSCSLDNETGSGTLCDPISCWTAGLSMSGSGCMTVPPPFGFLTFLILMEILFWIT
jgi:hypothetical protein